MDRSTTSTEPPGSPEDPDGRSAKPGRPFLGSLRDADVRVFSSASDAPRARRPTDVVLVALALIVIGLITIVAPGPGQLDRTTQQFLTSLPGLFGWFWETAYDVLFVWAVVLIAIPIVARKRTRMLIGELLAAALTFLFGAAVSAFAGVPGADGLRGIAASDPPARYPAMRLAVAAAVVVAASPHVSRPLSRIGRFVLLAGALASIALGVALPSGVVAGFAVGIGAAAFTHLVLGSPGGRLSLEQVRIALADLGVTAADLRYAPLSPSGVAVVLGRTAEGRSILVKIYGRDAWDGQLITSLWSSVWNRGETPRVGGRLQQVEHEAFVTLLAERSGITVQPVVTAGLAEGRDAILVIETGDARPLSALGPDDVDDATLRRIWELNAALFRARIAHGELDAEAVVIRPDGTPALSELGGATVSATTVAMQADRAQLLVATALTAGYRRAVHAARTELGGDAIAVVLPYLQPAALTRPTRRALSDVGWKLDDLRAHAAEVVGVEVPKLEQLRRVTVASVLMVVVIGLVAWAVDLGDRERRNRQPHRRVPGGGARLAGRGDRRSCRSSASRRRSARSARVSGRSGSVRCSPCSGRSRSSRSRCPARRHGSPWRSASSAGSACRRRAPWRLARIDSVSGFLVEVSLIALILLTGISTLQLGGADGHDVTFTGKWLLIGGIALALLITIVIVDPEAPGDRRRQGRGGEARHRRQPRRVPIAHQGRDDLRREPRRGAPVRGGPRVLRRGLRPPPAARRPDPHVRRRHDLRGVHAGARRDGRRGSWVYGRARRPRAAHTAALSIAMTFRLATYYLPPIWGGFAMGWLRRHEYV